MRRQLAKSNEELAPLRDAVKAGKLRDVQEWLASGKPIHFPSTTGHHSIIETAAKTGFYSMVEVLLPEWPDKDTLNIALNRAIRENYPEIAILLLDHGADANYPYLSEVAECYSPDLMNSFLDHGVDIADDDALAYAIAAQVRPIAGVFRERCPGIPGAEIQLAKALKYFVDEGNHRWVGLTLWMGANPRLRVPCMGEEHDSDPTNAIEDAYYHDDLQSIKLFKFDPSLDNPQEYLNLLPKPDLRLIRPLLEAGARINNKPNGGCSLVDRCVSSFGWWTRRREREGKGPDPYKSLEALIGLGARFVPDDDSHYRWIRDSICALGEHDTYLLLGAIAEAATWEIVFKILRTPRVREHIGCGPKQFLKWLGTDDPDENEEEDDDMARGPFQVSRRQLYNEIWQLPMQKVAAKYDISDVGLAKICRKHDIPRPPRGYWAKVAAGKKVKKPSLPKMKGDQTVAIGTSHGIRIPEQGNRAGTQDRSQRSAVPVPETLRKVHPAVRQASKLLRNASKDSDALLRSPDEACLDISVSKAQLSCALRIMQALIDALISDGYEFVPPATAKDPTAVVIHGEKVGFSISESIDSHLKGPLTLKQYKAKHRWGPSSYDYVRTPSGRLTLSIPPFVYYGGDGLRHNWRDGKMQRLEDILGNFIAGLRRAADWLREQRLEREAEQARKAEEKRRKEEEMRRYKEELAKYEEERSRVRELSTNASALKQAEEIRHYVSAVKRRAADDGKPIDAESDLGKWITWALQQADRIDPLKESPESLLDNPPVKPSSSHRW